MRFDFAVVIADVRGTSVSTVTVGTSVIKDGTVAGPLVLIRREVDVLPLVAEGLDDADIAVKLSLSLRTVQEHLKHLRRKAGAETRAKVITRPFAAGVLLPGTLPPRWSGAFCLYVPPGGA